MPKENEWLIPVLTVVVAGLFSLMGSWFGSRFQSASENQLEVAKARNASLTDLYKFEIETNDYPEELLTAQRASKFVTYMTLATPGTIHSIAELIRKNPGCTDFSKADCQVSYLSEIEAERSELGIDKAESKDLADVLRGPFQAMGQVSRGRSDAQVMLISPNKTILRLDEIPALQRPFPAAFSAKFPSKRFVLAVDAVAYDEPKVGKGEKQLFTVCTSLAGMTIQPARGFNPRIPAFRSISVARAPLKGQRPADKRKCLIDAADNAIKGLLTRDPNTIPIAY